MDEPIVSQESVYGRPDAPAEHETRQEALYSDASGSDPSRPSEWACYCSCGWEDVAPSRPTGIELCRAHADGVDVPVSIWRCVDEDRGGPRLDVEYNVVGRFAPLDGRNWERVTDE